MKMGAETPDLGLGRLVFAHTMLSRLELSDDVREITACEFDAACKRLYAAEK
jgi:hypothetical protein